MEVCYRGRSGWLALALTVVAATALTGCGGSSSGDAEQRAQERIAAQVAEGRQVFAAHCASCHAIGGRPRAGSTGEYGPNFDQVKPKRAHVLHRLELGGYGMQSFADELSAREKNAVATFVATVSGRDVPKRYVVPQATLAAGEAGFERYCQSCHAIADKRRVGEPVWPGTNFNNVRQNPARIQHMIDDGEFWMPKLYDKVPRRTVHDIIEYVVATSGRGPDVNGAQ